MGFAHEVVPRLLLVDDDPNVLDFYQAVLSGRGFEVETADDGQQALERIAGGRFDLLLSDVDMPRLNGIELLRSVRALDLDLPVVLATGSTSVTAAMQATEQGALRWLTKPVDASTLRQVVEYAVRLYRMARMQREARSMISGTPGGAADRAGLEVRFQRALDSLWMAWQPIVSWSRRVPVAYEALLRSDEPSLVNPRDLVEAAERLDKLKDVGRAIRRSVARTLAELPRNAGVQINVHAQDLEDDDLYDLASPLSNAARRVVLEINDRSSLRNLGTARDRVRALRDLGYRLAIDDLGAGDGGLSVFSQLEPDMVKLDMMLVRGVDKDSGKERVIRSMAGLCRDLNVVVVTEGVETAGERDTVVAAGCDLLQGYLFGHPDRTIAVPVFA